MKLVDLVHCLYLIQTVIEEKKWTNTKTVAVPFLARFVDAVVSYHKDELKDNALATHILQMLLLAAFGVFDVNMSDLGQATLWDAPAMAKDAGKWRQIKEDVTCSPS